MKGIVLILAGALALIGFGYVMGGTDARIERDEARGQYASALATATIARDAANARAANIEKHWSASVTAVGTAYEEIIKNEKATTDRTITDLRNDVVRLRVRTQPARGGDLPGPAAAASERDAATDQTLAPAVAARLAERYAEHNEVVEQLTACQAILQIERAPADE